MVLLELEPPHLQLSTNARKRLADEANRERGRGYQANRLRKGLYDDGY